MLLERDRDRPVGQAVQEVGRAVERVDDPAVVRRRRAPSAPLSSSRKAVVGPGAGSAPARILLGAAVGGGDEVARALDRDLELLDLAEVAHEVAGGLYGRAAA